MANHDPKSIICSYLQDAIAAENSFETSLRKMAGEGDNPTVQQMFAQHADETRRQHEMLTARLKELGDSPSGLKSFMAHLFTASPKSAQLGHEDEEKTTQNLMIAYAVENSEVAMYESLATAAAAAGDTETERLARQIQQQEKETAKKVWNFIAPSAREAFDRLASASATR